MIDFARIADTLGAANLTPADIEAAVKFVRAHDPNPDDLLEALGLAA